MLFPKKVRLIKDYDLKVSDRYIIFFKLGYTTVALPLMNMLGMHVVEKGRLSHLFALFNKRD